jgi:phosphatidylinositol glycan class F
VRLFDTYLETLLKTLLEFGEFPSRTKKLIFVLKPYAKVARGAVVLVAFWLLFAYVAVCFGAPVVSHHYETASFSALLTLLTVFPAVIILGPESETLTKVFLFSGIADSDPLAHVLFRNALGAVVGAWFGAFPIPLDWDRPWQAWPITCVIGAAVGSAVAGFWSLFVVRKLIIRFVTHVPTISADDKVIET